VMMGADASADAILTFWTGRGCREVVVKIGKNGCVLPDRRTLAPSDGVRVVDTTGAGDSFNAAYLSSRVLGAPPLSAARAGNRLAAWVIGQQGAIPVGVPEMYRPLPQETD